MTRLRRILHPSDFSSASSGAYRQAVELAKANRAELLLVHVLAPLVLPTDGYVSPKVYDEMNAAAQAEGRKHLDALVKKAKQAGVRVRSLLLEGVPHERIAQAARSRNPGTASSWKSCPRFWHSALS